MRSTVSQSSRRGSWKISARSADPMHRFAVDGATAAVGGLQSDKNARQHGLARAAGAVMTRHSPDRTSRDSGEASKDFSTLAARCWSRGSATISGTRRATASLLLSGYNFWSKSYDAVGCAQRICVPAIPTNVGIISQDNDWHRCDSAWPADATHRTTQPLWRRGVSVHAA
ncbi:hypothetical protein ABID19_006615 [Mesorhizobium robiniae]|uniref:Uncharacterized protein n=1 Tax=Mesorhizobium robiniae TaxID=559315 RepID=A0ABV2GZ33_9HYPH